MGNNHISPPGMGFIRAIHKYLTTTFILSSTVSSGGLCFQMTESNLTIGAKQLCHHVPVY